MQNLWFRLTQKDQCECRVEVTLTRTHRFDFILWMEAHPALRWMLKTFCVDKVPVAVTRWQHWDESHYWIQWLRDVALYQWTPHSFKRSPQRCPATLYLWTPLGQVSPTNLRQRVAMVMSINLLAFSGCQTRIWCISTTRRAEVWGKSSDD